MAEKTTPRVEPKAQTDRLESFFEKFADIEEQNRQAAYQAIDEYAKLMKATVDYTTKLQDEWRRIALDSSRRAQDMMAGWV